MPKGKQRERQQRSNLVTGVDSYAQQNAQNPETSRRLQSLIPSLAGDLAREAPNPTFLASVGAKVGFLFDYNKSNGDGTNTHFFFAATSTQLFLSVAGVWTAQSLPLPPDPPATPSSTPLVAFPQAVVINNLLHISDGAHSWIFDGTTWLIEGFPIPLVGPTFAIQNNVFTGAGLNDATFNGPYTGLSSSTYTVIIDATGTPDTFKWQKGSGSFTSGVAITGAVQTLAEGVQIKFGATTGHTLNNQWVTVVTPNFNIPTNRYYWTTWADETVGARKHEGTSSPGLGGGLASQGPGAAQCSQGAPCTAAASGPGIAWSNPNNIKVSDAAYATAVLAPPGQQSVGPNGCNNPSDLPNGNGIAWNNLTNIEVQDNISASASTTLVGFGAANPDTIKALGFGFNIPLTATINGIVVTVKRNPTGNLSQTEVDDNLIQLVKGGIAQGDNKSTGAKWIGGTVTYGSSSDLWNLSFTPAQINAIDFGIEFDPIFVNNSSLNRPCGAIIDFIGITVYYTPLSGTSQELQATNFGFNVPGSATIAGIQVEVQRLKTAGTGTIQDNDITILKGGLPVGTNKATGSTWPGAEAYAVYGSSSDLWGVTWSPPDINSMNFGVQVSAIETTGNSATAGVDFIRITVWYSTTAGTNAVSIGVIVISKPANPPVRATHWHLYASESDNSQIGYFLASVPVATSTYTDSSPFIGLGGSIFLPIERPVRNDPPVPSKIAEVHKYRIFRRRESKPTSFNFTANEEVKANLNGSSEESTPGTDANTQSDIVNENPYPNQSLAIRGIRSHGDALYFATEKDITPMYGQSITDFTLSQITAFKLGLIGRWAWDSTPHGLAFISYDKKAMLYPSQWPAGMYGNADTTSSLIEIGRPLRNILATMQGGDDNIRTVFYNYNKRNWWVVSFLDNTNAYQTWVFDFETQGWFQLQRGVSSLAVFEVSPGNLVLMGGDSAGQVWVLDDITNSFTSNTNLPLGTFRPALIDWNAPDHYHIFKYIEFEVSNVLIGTSSITINYYLDPADVDNPGTPTGTLNLTQVKGSNMFRGFPQPGTLCYRLLLEILVAADANAGTIRGLNIVADEAASLIL